MKTTRRLPIRSCQPGTKAQEGGRYGEGERELSLRWGGRQWRALPDCIKITHHCRVQVSASQQDITLWTAFSFQPTLQSKTSDRFLLSCLFIYFLFFLQSLQWMSVVAPPHAGHWPSPSSSIGSIRTHFLPLEEVSKVSQASSSHFHNMKSSRHAPSRFIYGTGN